MLQEVKFFTYENSPKHKIEKDAIAEVQTRGCFPQQKQAYTVNILVPPTPPTDFTTSKIVQVKYHLSVSENWEKTIPLTVLFVVVDLFEAKILYCSILIETRLRAWQDAAT